MNLANAKGHSLILIDSHLTHWVVNERRKERSRLTDEPADGNLVELQIDLCHLARRCIKVPLSTGQLQCQFVGP